jgi:hypothetical protein
MIRYHGHSIKLRTSAFGIEGLRSVPREEGKGERQSAQHHATDRSNGSASLPVAPDQLMAAIVRSKSATLRSMHSSQ